LGITAPDWDEKQISGFRKSNTQDCKEFHWDENPVAGSGHNTLRHREETAEYRTRNGE
jgi:hypothetical protein